MTSTQPTGRPPRRKRGQSPGQRIATMMQSWRQRQQTKRRQQELRRIRQQREQVTPAAEPQLASMRRTKQFRGLQRWLRRRQSDQQPSRTPMAWLWPRAGEILTTGDAAAQLMRNGSSALLLVSLISLVVSAVPVRVTSPNWYMEILAYIGETVPVLVLACVLGLLSLVLGSDDRTAVNYRTRLLKFSRLGYILALLLLPMQLGFMTWLIGDAFNTNRNQLNAIRANVNSLIDGARQTTTTEQFVAYLRSRNLNANLESIAAAPLVQVRTEFIRSVKAQQQQEEQNLSKTTNAALLRYAANGLRLFASLLILAIFMRGYQLLVRRCSPSWSSNTEQSSQTEEPAASLPS
jgi:hypothetical protein